MEWGGCKVNMDCFNFSCPFRQNKTSSCNRCECVACPNRDSHEFIITWNKTLTDKELCELRAKIDPDYGVGRYC